MFSNTPYYSLHQILFQISHRHLQKGYHLNINFIRMISDRTLLNQLVSIGVQDEWKMSETFSQCHDEMIWRHLIKYYDLDVQKLVSYNGIDVTILTSLCCIGNLNLIKLLVKHFKLTNDHIKSCDNRIVRWNCSDGHLDVVKYLIETFDMDINDIRSSDDFAFRWSCANGHFEMVKYLIETFGSDGRTLNIRSKDDFALKWSCSNGNLDIVGLLLPFYQSNIEDVKLALDQLRIIPSNNRLESFRIKFEQLLLTTKSP